MFLTPFDITPEKLAKPHESKPWNPIIASVFYRAGVIEKWGMGTLNIIEWCKENGNPKPAWEIRAQSVVTTFLPSSFFTTGKGPSDQAGRNGPESRPESRPESLEDQVLNMLATGPLSKSELSQALGHRNISGGLKKVLAGLLKQEKIAYTIPEKPNSRLQKYKLI
ncbi:MAG: hypothetical protein K940chlam2_00182 [Chlamydiae bacterium]|nr:hypothetical protein [Chlamydiota bacterium]